MTQEWAKRQGPEEEWREFKRLDELKEVYRMLHERTSQWPQRWKQEGHEEGLEEGVSLGERKARRETACNLIQATELDDATIANATGLPQAEIQALRRELKH